MQEILTLATMFYTFIKNNNAIFIIISHQILPNMNAL